MSLAALLEDVQQSPAAELDPRLAEDPRTAILTPRAQDDDDDSDSDDDSGDDSGDSDSDDDSDDDSGDDSGDDS